MTWIDGSWDTIYLDGEPLPGIVRALAITPKRDIERTKAKGTDTKVTYDNGYEGATVDIEIELWRAVQVLTLGSMLSRLSPRQPGALATPHTIQHPLATLANVTKVYAAEYTLKLPEKGRMRIPIKLFEWQPGTPAKRTKSGGGAKKDLETGGKFGQNTGSGLQGRVQGEYLPPDPVDVGSAHT